MSSSATVIEMLREVRRIVSGMRDGEIATDRENFEELLKLVEQCRGETEYCRTVLSVVKTNLDKA